VLLRIELYNGRQFGVRAIFLLLQRYTYGFDRICSDNPWIIHTGFKNHDDASNSLRGPRLSVISRRRRHSSRASAITFISAGPNGEFSNKA
jgi:hypothetical protein